MTPTFTIGLPQMHHEAGERRAFLPSFVGRMEWLGAQVTLENGYGAGMGYRAGDYRRAAPGVRFGTLEDVYCQHYVLVVRYPSAAEVDLMAPGGCLISMVHYPTRPERVADLRQRGLEAISLDSIKDDVGRRLIENLRSVAWNGVEVAFQVLAETYPAPGFASPQRPPIRVTLIGAGAVGSYVLGAAIRYGDEKVRRRMVALGVPGVQVTAVDYDLTGHHAPMLNLLADTDILVDATQRPDPSQVVIPNDWLAYLPQHAVLVDLSVDPYDCAANPPKVKGIEGVPHGSLDQYVFAPDDPAWDQAPPCLSARHRRHAVSCYSWPGLHPKACMEVYGQQLQPIMRTLIAKGGPGGIDPAGRFFERAIVRAQLSRWAA
jgi:alanine dehydrogenase